MKRLLPLLTFALSVASVCAAPVRIAVEAGESLAAVRNRVRALPEEARQRGVDVVFASGDYRVPAKGLELDERDGGASGGAIVKWRAERPGSVRFIGAERIPLSAFARVDDPAVLARLPEEARGVVLVADVSKIAEGEIPELADTTTGRHKPPVLFMDHGFGTLARWPNAGYATFAKKVDDRAFVFGDSRVRRWNFASGVWLDGYWTHDWSSASVRAACWGEENGTENVMRLAAAVPYGVMGRGTWGMAERRFYAFNMIEELDAPGEWWLDRKGKRLYVVPKEGAKEVFLALSDHPMVHARRIRNFAFGGIVFEYGYGGGVRLEGAEKFALVDCAVKNVAGRGVWADGNMVRIRDCEIANCGLGGISLSGGDRRTLSGSGNLVERCRIHDFGILQRTYEPGVRVDGVGATVRCNEIFDAPHSAVIYGGNEHLFESNDVHHVVMETGDAGAFYTGRDWTTQGNVLRYNRIHDIGAGTTARKGKDAAVSGTNAMGFYFDDCDCGDAVCSNEFRNVSRGIMIGGGRDHPVVGNVFSNCTIGLSIDCRGMTWKNWNVSGGSWDLEGKARKLDYTRGVWAERYPRLADIMNDHPREPLYNPVVSNVFIDCTGELLSLDKAATPILPRMAPIKDNLVIYTKGEGARRARIDGRIADGFRVEAR